MAFVYCIMAESGSFLVLLQKVGLFRYRIVHRRSISLLFAEFSYVKTCYRDF